MLSRKLAGLYRKFNLSFTACEPKIGKGFRQETPELVSVADDASTGENRVAKFHLEYRGDFFD